MQSNNISSNNHACCQTTPKKWVWYRDQLIISLVFLAVFLSLGRFVSLLNPFQLAFWHFVRMIWWAVLAGMILGGLIDYYIPKIYISKYLARRRKQTIFYSVGLGFLMSACSHGILALAMELHKKGAGGPAVVSFLLASPWANLPVTFLLVGFFGIKGVLIIFCALVVAIVTGLIFQKLEARGLIEKNIHEISVDEDFSILEDVKHRWQAYPFSSKALWKDALGIVRGMWELSEMILGWILIGSILASLVSAYVPSHFFHHFLGSSFMGLGVTLAFSALLEVCSEGTAPLAFEIYKQTGALGNSLVFLMAGVATDYTEIGLIWTNLGKKTALWMMGISIPQILFLGWLLNLLRV
ncbi:MAG: permease [Chlamydiae bacterium]|nr:permease [Chlamydiota bacterium]MBI3277602.1 permease [Chlamydiota bacterium]